MMKGNAADGLRRMRHLLVELTGFLASMMIAVVAAEAAGYRAVGDTREGVIAVLSSVLSGTAYVFAVLLPCAFLFRHRYRSAVTWGTGIAQLLLSVGPLMAFVLPGYLRRAPTKRAIWAVVLYIAGLVVFFLRDARGPAPRSSFVRLATSGEQALDQAVELSIPGMTALFVIFVVVPIGLGLLARSRAALKGTEQRIEEAIAVRGELSKELTRAQERDAIVRELHDTIGHRLSMVNVYAGGLEFAAEDHPELAQNARLVRSSAQQAVDDLRTLVRVMREPGGLTAHPVGPSSLESIVALTEEMIDAGRPLSVTMLVANPEHAPQVVVHAVHRIVQELLTNAARHAPSSPMRLKISGGKGRGLEIEASNPATAKSGEELAGICHGTGITGIRERASALGGEVTIDDTTERFTVRIRLPWE